MKHLTPFLFCLCCCAGLPTASAQLMMNQSNGVYSFSMQPNTLPALSKPDGYYKVFINTGDGHYFLGTYKKPASSTTNPDLYDLSTFKYEYKSSGSGSFQPYAEFVSIYDDDKEPKRMMVSNRPSAMAFTSTPEPSNTNNVKLRLDWVRKMVPNHENTFIAVVKNTTSNQTWYNVKIDFDYDPSIFDFDNTLSPSYLVAQSTDIKTVGTNAINPSRITMSLPTPLSPDQQISVFFPLKTKSTVPVGTNVKGLKATLSWDGSLNDTKVEPQDVKIEASQDPNHKTWIMTAAPATNEWIEYRVDFQNEGPGNATHVHVTDELDLLLINSQPILADAETNGIKQTPQVKEVAPRVWQWNFDNITLMGTHDPNYTADQEAKTKGFIKFRVQIGQALPCQSIVNRARIVFDCNPAIHTNFSFVPMGCNARTAATLCTDTIQSLPAMPGVAAGASIKELLPLTIAQQLQADKYTNFKWYPATHLKTPLIISNTAIIPRTINTAVDMARPETYVLIASKSCDRRTFYVSVRPTGIATDLPILVEDTPGDCVAKVTLFGGKPPYTYTWSSPGAKTTTISKMPYSVYLDLAGRPAMSLTVTDDNKQCPSVILSPVKGNCMGIPDPGSINTRH